MKEGLRRSAGCAGAAGKGILSGAKVDRRGWWEGMGSSPESVELSPSFSTPPNDFETPIPHFQPDTEPRLVVFGDRGGESPKMAAFE